LRDFETRPQSIHIEPDIVGFWTALKKPGTGKLEKVEEFRRIYTAGDAGRKMASAGFGRLAPCPTHIWRKFSIDYGNGMGPMAADDMRILAICAPQFGKPRSGIQDIIVSGDERQRESLGGQEIGKVFCVWPIVAG
jgi:hypothetical protein